MKHIKYFESYNQQRMNSGTVKYIDSSIKYDWNYSPEITTKKNEDEEEEEEEEELKEEIIGKYNKKIDITYEIDKTEHARIRQHREKEFISDDDINSLAKRSIETIANALLFDEIDIGDKIHIKDPDSDLNIVGQIEEEYSHIKIIIITIMRTKKFYTTRDTKTLKI